MRRPDFGQAKLQEGPDRGHNYNCHHHHNVDGLQDGRPLREGQNSASHPEKAVLISARQSHRKARVQPGHNEDGLTPPQTVVQPLQEDQNSAGHPKRPEFGQPPRKRPGKGQIPARQSYRKGQSEAAVL